MKKCIKYLKVSLQRVLQLFPDLTLVPIKIYVIILSLVDHLYTWYLMAQKLLHFWVQRSWIWCLWWMLLQIPLLPGNNVIALVNRAKNVASIAFIYIMIL